ncbi:uncharacterized protein LOC128857733 [Anastrepha ludens]|uniref:uncharacterized protein LOC128857733 n=1 Tax=Anastrepha ludens TaxID=28586 RepID=UPI0023AFCB84|nr:uncharacterized protein LOC128857733 [Anastrepha ludens]
MPKGSKSKKGIDNTSSDATGNSSDSISFNKRKSASIKHQLTALNKTLSSHRLDELDEAELSVHLEYVESIHDNFDHVHSILEEADPRELDGVGRAEFFDVYLEVKAKLSRQLNSHRKTNIRHSSTARHFALEESPATLFSSQRKSRLPELKIPKFSGAYIDWPNFFAMFSSVIDKDLELSKVEKLQHLRTSLQGAALETICSLEPVEENYDKAIALLKNRFDNKLLIFQAHIRAIIELKSVDKGSANRLRELCDNFNSHLRALNTMATPEQISDGLLIHLVTRKFDQKTQEKWEEDLPMQTLPTLNSMTSFLEKRCRIMENLEGATQTLSNQIGKHSNANKGMRNALVASSSSSSFCIFCDSKEHYINSCLKFLNLSPNLRYKEAKRLQLCLNCLRKGHSLQRCKSGHCRHCPGKHNSLLHMNPHTSSISPSSNLPTIEATAPSQQTLISSLTSSTVAQAPNSGANSNVLLATAILSVKNRSGDSVPCRAILDSASQINFVTARLANMLQLPFKQSAILISGIGESNFVADKEIDVFAQSQDKGYNTSFTAVVTPSITDYRPNFSLSSEWIIPSNINLADPLFFKPQRIDLLIGAGLFFDLMCVGQIRIASNLPLLQKTRLGWVVAGGVSYTNKQSSSLAACSKNVFEHQHNNSLNDIVKRFWEIENCFDSTPPPSKEDDWCEQHFKKYFSRLTSGEYSVRLPTKTGFSDLGDSYNRALRRFKGLERKLENNHNLRTQYIHFMSEYISLNHMSLATPGPTTKTFFLPHHCVQKFDSTTTKLRVVFDGSAKTTTGYSLNDLLLAGPTIQAKLFKTLLQFRFRKFALCGDICKMYRCVRMTSPDEYLQCILWRENPLDEVKVYKLDTVTYGTKSAAFLAIRAMHQLSYDEEGSFPIGAKIVRRDFYVDDLISGGDTIEEVIEIRRQVKGLLQRGGFNIRKWCSNEDGALQGVLDSDCENLLKFHDGSDVAKTLGLIWDPKTDNFLFSFSPIDNNARTTKRTILSHIAKIYDPLGLVSPVITKAKIFLQILWKEKLQWDESLPQLLQTTWNDICVQLGLVSSFKFPRFVLTPNSSWEIHAFCDASLAAFGACVYIRSECDGILKSCLLCAKSRVSPLKSLTIPKLELSAALLLAELVAPISLDFPHSHTVHCWSDSMVTLSWLREQPTNFNIFVSNRVSQIQTLTKGMTWHHVPTSLNPADILSRGCTPKELLNSELWRSGPQFLSRRQSDWPNLLDLLTDLPERRRKVLVASQLRDITLDCKYHNSFERLQRIFAYIYYFCQPHRTRVDGQPLTPLNIKMGTHLLIRNIQQIHFAAELKPLRFDKKLNSSSKLHSLNPFIDSFGLLRVGGRLQNSLLDFEAKHPPLLPKHHPVTNAIIDHFHRKYLHAGPQSVLASIRQQYWPIGGRKTVASVINKCIRCFRLKPIIYEHIMGSLPADRVQANRTFFTTGIDYCGPFYYKSEVRSRPPIKCYICVFVCFSTKACHLELTQDLSTSSFLAALKRFICTRGKPHTIWSDNATNFVGAKNELQELSQLFSSNSHNTEVTNQCNLEGISWKFIPPRSPHFGGLWEAAVKSAKFHFLRTVGLSILTFEELRTLVCEIGAIVNSRPLCPISENPDDLNVLTPAHFLIGAPFTSVVEPDVTGLDISRLSRWQRVCHMQQVFWKRWSSSYLSLLQERVKWRKSTGIVQVGNMVILKEENLPPLKWRLGRVESLIRGADGVARIAIIYTANGLVKRAVGKIAVLPIETEAVGDLHLPTGGGCSQQH